MRPIDRSSSHRPQTSRGWWPRWKPRLKRALPYAFFAAVAVLLASQARTVDWPAVSASIRRLPASTLAIAAACVVLTQAIYSTYDLIGRAFVRHRLSIARTIAITFTSYAFNLNLGSLVGGFAFRYRLYSRFGVDAAQVTRILALSLVTNWIGYLVLAGVIFTMRWVDVPPDWRVGQGSLQIVGAALLAVALAYVGACGFSSKREITVRGHSFELPRLRVALLQVALSCANWSAIAFIVFVLMRSGADPGIGFPTVLGVMMLSAVAGVLTHVPAGLGVLETVVIALLGYRIARPDLLGVLFAYRALYYLAPLVLASLMFVWLEARAKAQARDAPAQRVDS